MSKAKSEGERLKEQISGRRSRTDTLSTELREEAAAYARRRVDVGTSPAAVARELGVSAPTVGRWLARNRSSESPKKLLPVRVPASSSDATSRSPAPRTFVITSRGGLRVDALSLADVAELLRVHG